MRPPGGLKFGRNWGVKSLRFCGRGKSVKKATLLMQHLSDLDEDDDGQSKDKQQNFIWIQKNNSHQNKCKHLFFIELSLPSRLEVHT